MSERVHTGLLARLGGHFAAHPWRTILTWVAIIVGLAVANGAFPGKLIDEFDLPDSDTARATDLLESKFPARKGDALTIVYAAPVGERLDTPERKAALAQAVELAEQTPNVVSADDPLAPATLAENGRIAYGDVQFSEVGFEIKREDVVALEEGVAKLMTPLGVQTEFTGGAEVPPIEQGTSELIGLIVAFFVLLVLFRAFVPTFIPIVFAIVSVGSALMLLFLLTHITNFNTVTLILVPMIGLGVGIDYTLFIVTRFRQFLHDGLEPREAAAAATATAGRAVLFAGLTVAISITGLAFIGLDFITKLGIGSALGVLTSVLMATSLLPAVLSLLGHKIDRWKVPFLPASDDSEEGRQRTWVAHWGRFVTRRAAIVLPVVLGVLLLLALPALNAQLGLADAGTAPKDTTTRQAYDLLAEGFGAGFNGPIPIVVDQTGDPDAVNRVHDALQGVPGVAQVNEPVFNDAEDVGLVNVLSSTSPQSEATNELVDRLRDDVIPQALAGSTARAYVSGQTAAFADIGDHILSHLPQFLLYIIGVTFLVLAMAFRSVVVALKASLTTIMSAFVGFGVLVFVVQMGNALGVTGLDRTGPIESFVPPIAFAILFGLSMDYEVFLMSRIREEHVHGKDTIHAVTDGMAAIGRVIVAAAVIGAHLDTRTIAGTPSPTREAWGRGPGSTAIEIRNAHNSFSSSSSSSSSEIHRNRRRGRGRERLRPAREDLISTAVGLGRGEIE